MFNVPPDSAVQDFQALYERHYGVKLSADDAEQKLRALLGLLSAARTSAPRAPTRGGGSRGHGTEYYRDHLSS